MAVASHCQKCGKSFATDCGYKAWCSHCDPFVPAEPGRKAELREHWIREHLPVMALDYMKTHSYEDCAKKSLELIDACLDAVCKGGDDGTPQT